MNVLVGAADVAPAGADEALEAAIELEGVAGTVPNANDVDAAPEPEAAAVLDEA